MYLKKSDINLLYLTVFPISYYSYNFLKNFDKKVCYFCYAVCLVDKNGCFSCWENILKEKTT